MIKNLALYQEVKHNAMNINALEIVDKILRRVYDQHKSNKIVYNTV